MLRGNGASSSPAHSDLQLEREYCCLLKVTAGVLVPTRFSHLVELAENNWLRAPCSTPCATGECFQSMSELRFHSFLWSSRSGAPEIPFHISNIQAFLCRFPVQQKVQIDGFKLWIVFIYLFVGCVLCCPLFIVSSFCPSLWL